MIDDWCSNFFELTSAGFRSFDHLLAIENTTTENLDDTNCSLIVSSSFMTRSVASRALFVFGTYISKPSY